MTDNDMMPFGKYKGEKMVNVPASYLLWAIEQQWCRGEIKQYILNNLDVLKAQVKQKV